MNATTSSSAGHGDSARAGQGLVEAASRVARGAAGRAVGLDQDGAFPSDDIAALGESGLLVAPLPPRFGGHGLGLGEAEYCRRVLGAIGQGSLSLGRLYEGHVNAVALAARYGSTRNLERLGHEVARGRLSGVWMAGEALRLERRGDHFVLHGKKVLCSGAGHIERPIVAADLDGGSVMVMPDVADRARVDNSGWVAHGMRATATGTVDFTGLVVEADDILGQPGDYLRSPHFRGGAWRVIAVQLGGLEAIVALYRSQLDASPHRDHPLQLARFGEALIAVETARLWVERAGIIAEGGAAAPAQVGAQVDAYVDLARNAFEGAARRTIELAQKAIGLKSFMGVNPLERAVRDLATYLRQPALDASLMSAAAFHLASDEAAP